MPVSRLQAVAALADPLRRLEGAKRLATYLGAEDLIIFVRDPEVGSHLPGVGFPKTFPNGRAWQEFVRRCASGNEMLEADLPYPDASTIRRARGISCQADSVLILLGGSPRAELVEDVREGFPLLTSIFLAERRAAAGEAHAAVARAAAERAEALTASLAISQAELHRVLRRLQESEQRFSTTLRSIGDAVIATDAGGRVTFMNPVAESLTGWSLEDSKASPLQEVFKLIDEVSRAPVEGPVEKVLREGKAAGLANHTMLVRKNGHEVSIDDSAAPIHDATGAVVGVVLVFRDITNQRRAEIERDKQHRLAELGWRVGAALASNEPLNEQLRRCTDAIVQHVDAALARVWTLNDRDRVLELQASSGMCSHMGRPQARVPVGAFEIGLIAEEQKPHLSNDVQNDPRVSDRAWAKREGIVSFAGYPLLVEGRLVGVVALFWQRPLSEMTLRALEAIAGQLAVAVDKAAAEVSLRRSELRYQLATRATREAVRDWDIISNSLGWNEGVQALFGYTKDQVGPDIQWWYETIHPEDRERVVQGIHAVIDSGGTNWNDEYRYRRGDGTYAVVFDRGYVARDPSGRPVQMVGAMQDVTELKKREEFEKQLIGIVSHDLRNPLNAVLMAAEVLLTRDEMDERTSKSVLRIKSSADRAARMIRDLLDFTQARLSGRVRVEPKRMDLHEVARNVIEETEFAYPDRRIEGVHEGDGTGEWDGDRLTQLLTNLLQNAVKYSPADTPVRVHTASDGAEASVTVHNQGSPIPADRLPRLFEPLQRASHQLDKAGRSIGLGLYIVKHIAEAHGGTITVSSTEQDGTTFAVRIPRVSVPM